METAGIRFPLTLTADDGRSSLIGFSASDEPSVTLDQLQPRRLVTIHGTGQMLTGFTSLLCRQFPWVADHRSLYDAAQHLRAAVRMANADGQAAVLAMTQGPVQALLSADAPLEVLQPLFPHADLRRHTDFAPIFTHTFPGRSTMSALSCWRLLTASHPAAEFSCTDSSARMPASVRSWLRGFRRRRCSAELHRSRRSCCAPISRD